MVQIRSKYTFWILVCGTYFVTNYCFILFYKLNLFINFAILKTSQYKHLLKFEYISFLYTFAVLNPSF